MFWGTNIRIFLFENNNKIYICPLAQFVIFSLIQPNEDETFSRPNSS